MKGAVHSMSEFNAALRFVQNIVVIKVYNGIKGCTQRRGDRVKRMLGRSVFLPIRMSKQRHGVKSPLPILLRSILPQYF